MGFEVPEWLKNIAMHAVSGFVLGFSAAFVANPAPALPELGAAIYAAAVIGFYGAIKEVAAYIQSITTGKSTAAKGAPKPLLERML